LQRNDIARGDGERARANDLFLTGDDRFVIHLTSIDAKYRHLRA
jgi:hypothetical protein